MERVRWLASPDGVANAVGGEPAPPAVAWRRGFAWADVVAGHPYPRPDAVAALSETLVDSHVAVAGRGATGKSTVCLLAARAWRERECGPVFLARDPPVDVDSACARVRDAVDAEEHGLVVVENGFADDGSAAVALLDAFDATDVTVLLELRQRDVAAGTAAALDVANPLRERAGDDLTIYETPTVDAGAFADAVEHYESVTGTTVSSGVDTLYDALRDEATEGNVLAHFAHWVGDPGQGESAVDRAVEGAFDDLAAAGDLALDVGVVAALLRAADLPLAPWFFYALDAENRAVDDALDAAAGVVLFYPRDDAHFEGHHSLWATRFLEKLADRTDGTPRFARAVEAVLSALDPADRATASEWFAEHSRHAEHVLGRSDDEASEVGGLLTSDARAPDLAVGTTSQVVDRLFAVGTAHPALAPLYGHCDDDTLDLSAHCAPTTLATAVLDRGRMYFDNGDYDRADAEFDHARALLADADSVPDPVVDRFQVDYHVARGRSAVRRSEFDRAHDHYRSAYDAARDLGDPTNRARSHLHLGVVDLKRGRLASATAHLEASRTLFRERGESLLAASVRRRLGIAYWQRGRLDDAERVLEAALDRFERAGDRVGVARCRNNLGLVLEEREQNDVAQTCYERSLQTSRDVGYRPGELKSRINLGNRALEDGDLGEATTQYRAVRELSATLGDRETAATALNNLGVVAFDRDDLDAAASAYRESLEVCRDIGDRRGEARAMNNLGQVARERGDLDRAVERLRESLAIRQEADQRVGQARTRHELGRSLADRGDLTEAREHLDAALETFESFDADERTAEVLADLAAVARERAIEHLERSREAHPDEAERAAVAEELAALREAAER